MSSTHVVRASHEVERVVPGCSCSRHITKVGMHIAKRTPCGHLRGLLAVRAEQRDCLLVRVLQAHMRTIESTLKYVQGGQLYGLPGPQNNVEL